MRQVSRDQELGVKYLQVRITATNFDVARDGAIVILIVQVLVIAAVLPSITEILPEPGLAADVKVSTESKLSLLADAEIFLSLEHSSHLKI